jgi:cyclophilin family peptidyl-prolyl cis-trans isomerase
VYSVTWLDTLPASVTVLAGAPLNLALNAIDDQGGPLTFSFETNNADLIGTIPTGNQSLRITTVQKDAAGNVIRTFGDMVFQLFDDLTPQTTAHIEQLVNQGFYDGVIFHRIIQNFVIQGGDPTGTGSGGSPLGRINDEYHKDLQFTSSGILAMAKSLDDTGDSQFFITAGPTRWLDFNHTIFGFLTQGESVRQAIASVAVTNDRPNNDVVMQSVTLFHDTQNAVLRLSAAEGKSGTAQVTVRVRDQDGNTASRTITVNIVPDTSNSNPFLINLPQTISATQPSDGKNLRVNLQLQAMDVEGDTVRFQVDHSPAGITFESGNIDVKPVNQVASLDVVIVADPALVGKKQMRFYVLKPEAQADAGDTNLDAQYVTVAIAPKAPIGVALDTAFDTGASNLDGYTSLDANLKFRVAGVLQGATVKLMMNGQVIGQATAPAPPAGQNPATMVLEVTLNQGLVLTPGTHTITAVQIFDDLPSAPSQALLLTIDKEPPHFSSTPPGGPFLVGVPQPNLYNVQTDEETAAGATYQLLTAPGGMTINHNTGLIAWTPQANQVGQHHVVVRATDLAGNFADHEFDLTVVPNTPPTLSDIDNRVVDEGSLLTFSASAHDVDLPLGDQLTFSLAAGAPAGASINPSTGLFTWRPSEAQGPGEYEITIVVRDSANQTDAQSFRVIVNEVNQAPMLDAIPAQTVAVGQRLVVQAAGQDPDFPTSALTYRIVDGPAGLTIDPSTGRIIWDVPLDQAAGRYLAVVEVSDQAGLVDRKSFTIAVHTRPVIEPIADQTVNEGDTLRLQVTASSAVVPPPTFTYALAGGAPRGVAIDRQTGLLTWTPTEEQGPGRFSLTVVVTDSNGLSESATFDVVVREINQRPTIAPVASILAAPGQAIVMQLAASDPDAPTNGLRFSLVNGPERATIDPATGLFRWNVPTDVAFAGIRVTVRVTDDGHPALSDETTFDIQFGNPAVALVPGGGPGLPSFVTPSVASGDLITRSALSPGNTVNNNGASPRQFANSTVVNGVAASVLINSTGSAVVLPGYLAEGDRNGSLGPIIRPTTIFQIGPDTGVGSLEPPAPKPHRARRPASNGEDGSSPRQEMERLQQAPEKNPAGGVELEQSRSSRRNETPNPQATSAAPMDHFDEVLRGLDLDLGDLVFHRLIASKSNDKLQLFSQGPGRTPAEGNVLDLVAAPVEQEPPKDDAGQPGAGRNSEKNNAAEAAGHFVSRLDGTAAAGTLMYLPLLVTELDELPRRRSRLRAAARRRGRRAG